MTIQPSKRLHYLDMLKGIAIFMVVAGHVLTMCIREIDRAALFKFIGEIHMPLFFFISGMVTLRVIDGGKWRLPALGKRAKQLLIPMAVVSTIWIFYFPHSGLQSPLNSSFSGLWLDEWKNGYWFTLVLFEIILVYAVLAHILPSLTSAAARIAVIAATWVILGVVAYVLLPGDITGILSIRLTFRFFPAFITGVLASLYKERFDRICRSSTAFTVSILVGGALLYFVCWPWEFPAVPDVVIDAARSALHICIAIVAITIVKPWSLEAYAPEAATPHRWARMWSYLGSNSLAIYLLHYFFLFPLGFLRPLVLDAALGFVPLLLVSSFFAAAIITVTLGFNRLISPSKPLKMLLTGA